MIFTKKKNIIVLKFIVVIMIDNAEKMIGDYQFFRDITITCYVNETDQAPYVNIDASFIPENFIKRIEGGY